MGLQAVIHGLSRQYGTTIPDHENAYTFKLNNERTIALERATHGHSFALYSDVCELPHHDREKIFRILLDANLFGKGTHRYTLALDNERERVVLFTWFTEAHTDYPHFAHELSTFLSVHRYWQDRIMEFPRHEEGPQGDSLPWQARI